MLVASGIAFGPDASVHVELEPSSSLTGVGTEADEQFWRKMLMGLSTAQAQQVMQLRSGFGACMSIPATKQNH